MNYVHVQQRASMYRFKRNFGFPVDIYKLLGSVTDPRTGVISVTTSVTHIDRAVYVCGPQSRKQLARKMAAGTEAARDFAASGSYDLGLATFIIDVKDAPELDRLARWRTTGSSTTTVVSDRQAGRSRSRELVHHGEGVDRRGARTRARVRRDGRYHTERIDPCPILIGIAGFWRRWPTSSK